MGSRNKVPFLSQVEGIIRVQWKLKLLSLLIRDKAPLPLGVSAKARREALPQLEHCITAGESGINGVVPPFLCHSGIKGDLLKQKI